MEIALVLGLLIVAIILFATEKFSVDLITVGLLIILTSLGILTPAEAFKGFGSDFIIMLASIFVVSGAMQKAGILEIIGDKFIKIPKKRLKWLPTYIMSTVGFTSAFMNNTTVTAMYVAPVVSMCRKLRISPSKILMPVAFASILGGTCTVIGTSTNIAVNAYLGKNGYATFGMFDFTLIGFVMMVIGIVFMATIGVRLLPGKKEVNMVKELEQKHYFTEVLVKPNSVMVNQKVRDTLLSTSGFKILNIIRDKQNMMANGYSSIEANDILLLEGNIEDLLRMKQSLGLDIYSEALAPGDMITDDIKIVEIFVTPTNDFLGQTIREAQFKRRFGLLVMAINREGQTLSDKIGDTEIKIGDRLLIQGPAVNIEYRRKRGDFTVLQEYNFAAPKNKRNALLTFCFFAGALVLGTFEIIPLSIAFMLAAFLCVAFKCIKTEEAYQKIEWNLLVLIGGMTSFGIAMEKTGTATFLADHIISLFGGIGPIAVMAAFSLLTVFLTQPMSNAAAAMVVLPVALEAAETMQVNPITFALTVMLSASVSMITPFEPSCILVYGPGGYKFRDFVKTGSLVTLILIVVILIMAPYLYPL
ncbi:MAG: anion permease [Bacteroidetes bacterium]|nr:anion permease [Bacteroidota bacterium]MBK8414042.1 anion permease [Bacteroidota bacterium]MBK8873472.1 anion permease [Bacteroidota bacterium]MBK9047794.1 anion permease [Bacteroidota bacterium]MBK9424453.1 anion permease [Bacteroidota bacterium]